MDFDIIHITGASGAGVTTLGRAICDAFGHTHLDTDDFFWEPEARIPLPNAANTADCTDVVMRPKFTVKRDKAERRRLLGEAIDASGGRCVISGSLTDWGDMFIPEFQLVIYVKTPTELRLERLRAREFAEFGDSILPGGEREKEHREFLDWAAQYDTAGTDMRSAAMHYEWLQRLTCPVVGVDGSLPVTENLTILSML